MIDERLGFGANCLAHDPIPPGTTKITAVGLRELLVDDPDGIMQRLPRLISLIPPMMSHRQEQMDHHLKAHTVSGDLLGMLQSFESLFKLSRSIINFSHHKRRPRNIRLLFHREVG